MTASVSAAAMADALSALVNLGYDRSEAARTVAEAARDAEAATAEVLIKAALQALARSL
jgi:holliday junction DNA helicase RuvA